MAQQKYDVFRETVSAKLVQNTTNDVAHRLGHKPNLVVLLHTNEAIGDVKLNSADADKVVVEETGDVADTTVTLLLEYYHSIEGDVGTTEVDRTGGDAFGHGGADAYGYSDGQANFCLAYKANAVKTYSL